MQTHLIRHGDATSLNETLKQLDEDKYPSILLLASAKNSISIPEYEQIFSRYKFNILGGVFPKLIHHSEIIEDGFILIPSKNQVKYCLLNHISAENEQNEIQIKKIASEMIDTTAIMIWVDGRSPKIPTLLNQVYDFFGATVNYLGGGAGFLDHHKPCVFADKKVHIDAAVIIETHSHYTTSVNHCYSVHSGPHLSSVTSGNIIHKIDDENAFDFYTKTLRADGFPKTEQSQFIKMSASYPIGIKKYDGSIIVRDPIGTDGSSITCIGDIPEDSVIYILKGSLENIFAASKIGTVEINKNSKNYDYLFIVDCINRYQNSDGQYANAISSVYTESKLKEVVGVFSLGEIASDGNHPLELFTRTIVQCGINIKK